MMGQSRLLGGTSSISLSLSTKFEDTSSGKAASTSGACGVGNGGADGILSASMPYSSEGVGDALGVTGSSKMSCKLDASHMQVFAVAQ